MLRAVLYRIQEIFMSEELKDHVWSFDISNDLVDGEVRTYSAASNV